MSVYRVCGTVPVRAGASSVRPDILGNAVLQGWWAAPGCLGRPPVGCVFMLLTPRFLLVVLSASVFLILLHRRIRASIAQFQQELIGHVKEAVSAIQDKFRHRYEVRFFAELCGQFSTDSRCDAFRCVVWRLSAII